MKLSSDQLARFERDGYLFFPGLFSAAETRVLTDAVPALYARREVYNVREKGSDAVRTNFAAHLYSEPFARLARHPRMLEPVQSLLGDALKTWLDIPLDPGPAGASEAHVRMFVLCVATLLIACTASETCAS